MKGDDAISFKWKTFSGENENTIWAPFKKETTYFDPSTKDWMINYIAKDLDQLLEKLKSKGIIRLGEIVVQPFGKFASILDPKGNKIEFCEPDREYFKEKY